MSEKRGERCENCRFWDDPDPDELPYPDEKIEAIKAKVKSDGNLAAEMEDFSVLVKYGYCKRYPPIAKPEDGLIGVPLTDHKDWCGEWQPATKEAKSKEDFKIDAMEAIFNLCDAIGDSNLACGDIVEIAKRAISEGHDMIEIRLAMAINGIRLAKPKP